MRDSKATGQKRRATWIGFCVVVLATLSVCNAERFVADHSLVNSYDHETTTDSPVDLDATNQRRDETKDSNHDKISDANRAYKRALQTLASIRASQQSLARNSYDSQSNSLFSTLFPNQQGPIASAVRILYKLRQQSWVPSFINRLLGREGKSNRLKGEEIRGKSVKAVDLLEYAVELGHMDALFVLAQISLFFPSPLLYNVTRSYEAYKTHADLTGNGTSQAMLGFFHSTGYHNLVDIDQAKALLYYTFGAYGGDQGAQMALGYRYWAGIGVNDDCSKSLEWYQLAAEQAMNEFIRGPPGGRTLPLTATRLSDLDGGAYGPGASWASTGLNAHRAVIKASSARQAGETWEDVLEYYMFNADRGEIDFAYRLGKIFYQGSIYSVPGGISSGGEGVGAIPKDYARARAYFLRIARSIWPRDSPGTTGAQPKKEHQEDGTLSYAAASAGFLGRMYLRGEGVKADPAMAKLWFDRGAEYGEKECHNGLGIIWRDGLVDGKSDIKKAVLHFGVAASQELAEAQVNLGKYHYHRGELKLATSYFESAIRNGSPFEPFFYLGEIHAANSQAALLPTHSAQGSCAMAVSFYKLVAERGAWLDDPLRTGEAKWKIGTDQAKEEAMLYWWIAAERGSEIAQNNLAYILDQDKTILRLTRFAPSLPSNETARLALTHWTRSAAQRNVDALVKVGDYYYHGLGVADEPEEKRWEKAAAFYQAAVDTQMSSLAMWNLGWMYENGVGVPQDFHLAKRHYDMALETNSEAYLAVVLSLIKLHMRSIWHTITGGKNGLTIWSEEAQTRKEPRVIDAPETESRPESHDDDLSDGSEDSDWYIGKARDDRLRRLRATQEQQRNEEEDPIQWARDRRNAENERDSDFGPEDYFDAAMRGGRREEQGGDDFAETMLISGLCLAVSVLIWLRGRWVERRRQEEQRGEGQNGEAPNANQDNGLFPPRGDPARDEWAVLR